MIRLAGSLPWQRQSLGMPSQDSHVAVCALGCLGCLCCLPLMELDSPTVPFSICTAYSVQVDSHSALCHPTLLQTYGLQILAGPLMLELLDTVHIVGTGSSTPVTRSEHLCSLERHTCRCLITLTQMC